MRALFIPVLVLGATHGARADDTFEARASGAQRVRHIDNLVWAFSAPCDAGTDTHQRQCRRLRDARAAQLATATLIVEAEREAFAVGAWSPQKKSMDLLLSACVRCSGVVLDGKTYYVVANKDGNPAPKFEGGKLRTGKVLDNARTFSDQAAAKKFAESTKAAKIQLLVKVPAKPVWNDGDKRGIALDVLGYRVYSACDGSIVLASPQSAAGEVDRKACMAAREVDELTPAITKESLKPVVDAAKACYATHKATGTATLKLAVASDGSIAEYEQEGDFVDTATGSCIDAAARSAAFPRSKKARTAVVLPISLP